MTERTQVTIIEDAHASKPYVAMRVGGQLFALPVTVVRDVMRLPEITPLPLSAAAIAGLINLRGEIVTVIDMRIRLALPTRPRELQSMLVIVSHGTERFALLVDTILDVLRLTEEDAEEVPATINGIWRSMAREIYTHEKELLVILDVAALIEQPIALNAA